MRLIDADVLKKSIVDARNKRMEEKPYGWEWEYNAYNHCIMIAGSMSVREPIEIIRCKDCKYSVDKYGEGDCYCYYDRNLNYIGDNWNHYCSWAERKEE